MRKWELLDDLDDDAIAARYAPPEGAEEWLRVNFVSSVDGAAEVDGLSGGLSGASDMRVFRMLRARCEALLVGAGTVRAEAGHYRGLRMSPDRVAWRRRNGMEDHPRTVVVTRGAELDPNAPLFVEAPRRPVVLTCSAAPEENLEALRRVAEVIVAGESEVDFDAGLKLLRRTGLKQILCEGGPQILGQLVAADLVDELCLTVSPLLAGGTAGRIATGPETTPRRMSLAHLLAAPDDSLLLRYVRDRG